MCRCECVCVSLATCPGCVPPLGRYMHLMQALCVFHSHTVDVVKHLWTWIVAFDRIAVSLNMAATILTWQSINLFSTLGFGTCDHVSLHNNRRVCMHQKQLSPACLFSCVESGRSSKAPLSIGSFDGLLLCVVHVYSFTSQIVISLILKSSGRHDWALSCVPNWKEVYKCE